MKMHLNKNNLNLINMKTKIFNLIMVTIFLTIGFISCSKDEPDSVVNHPSYRDGIYKGSQLTVTLNGKEVSTVSSVTLTSTLKDANVSPDKGPDDFNYPSNPTYYTTVKIIGFPNQGKTSTFTTISDLMGFEGETEIDNVGYEYVGEFTGDPLWHHDNQGLILNFTSINIP